MQTLRFCYLRSKCSICLYRDYCGGFGSVDVAQDGMYGTRDDNQTHYSVTIFLARQDYWPLHHLEVPPTSRSLHLDSSDLQSVTRSNLNQYPFSFYVEMF